MPDGFLTQFSADTDIRGHRINLTWTWSAPDERPRLRLVRRRRDYPTGPDDGLAVLEIGALFNASNQPWARIEQTVYTIPNSQTEGGLRQAEVTFWFPSVEATEPDRVGIDCYDSVSGQFERVVIQEVSRLVRVDSTSPLWSQIQTIEIFITPAGGPEASAGQIIVSTGHTDGVTPDRFSWIFAGEGPVGAAFDVVGRRETSLRVLKATAETFEMDIVTLQQGTPVLQVQIREAFDPDTGDWQRSGVLFDQDLEPEQVYYYRMFAQIPATGGYRSELEWRVMAAATGEYGFSQQLYRLLPALHKRYDEPDPNMRGKGQLRRFLQIFGAALDQTRSQAEALRARHDINEVRADLLPHLAHGIGWATDLTQNVLSQRNDIRFAPDIYTSLGTIPNIRALVNRVTGWDCRVKEFVHNVFLTNAPEEIHLWELWEQVHDGAAWNDPAPVTRTDGFDGRPAIAVDSGNVVWLFWHANRTGRREIWLQRPGIDASPRRAMLGAPDDAPGLTYTDENPAVVADGPRLWLFWESNREGAWEIYARSYSGLSGSAPVRLTEHSAHDRCPTAVRDAGGGVWVFWQSNRRGPTDIWARRFDGVAWGLPQRITTAAFRDEMPAAAVDGSGRIWLFWSADHGDRRNLYLSIHDGGTWSPPEAITTGLQRDESPAAVFWNGQMSLFWSSDRDGHWQILSRIHDGASWGAPFAVTSHVAADKEPAVVIDAGGELRLLWRSQRRGASYQSRTVDFNDPEMLARLETFEDHAHYTYDTGLDDRKDLYERGAVGVYLIPDTNDVEEIAQKIERVKDFVEPFRPLPVRLVWLLDAPLFEEDVDTINLISEEFSDEVL